MDLTSIANQVKNIAKGQDAVADNSNRILAVKKVSQAGYIIRARVDGLIRYYSVPHEAAANFPKGWETGSPDAILPPRTYPDDLKCIHLRRPGLTEFFDQKKPSHQRPSAQHPVAVEPLPGQQPHLHSKIQDVQHAVSADYETFEKLGKIPTPRFPNRPCDDRINIVRHPRIHNHQPMVMKIVEFPETWTFPQAPQSPSEAPTPAANTAQKLNVGSDGSEFDERVMRLEMRMHQKVAATPSLAGLVPKFLGLVTERGRGVIGYVSEYISDAKSFKQILEDAYAAGYKGFRLSEAGRDACRAALKRLHEDARLHHGDMHAGNVLRRGDGSVVLIDFEETFHLDKEGWVYGSFESAESERQRMERWLDGTASDWHQLHTMSLEEVD
ncbi:uncharacterized protein PG986_003837 [Apiospora aurea]|uniref:Aminoglycoside phosphotransferase domain-containing protein n=1 Tax=Apiospora aurea TaxID=335848 RepID=A0ABR1QKW5_9PEZI